MIHVKKMFALGLLMLTFTACSTSRMAPVEELRDLSTELKLNSSEYDFQDWTRAKKKYVKLNKKIARNDYSPEERREIGQLKGECVGYFAKGIGRNLMDKVDNAAQQMKGFIDGLKNSLEEQ